MGMRTKAWMLAAMGTLLAATTACGANAVKPAPKPYTRNVAVVLYEGVEALDFAGPLEVFAAAGGIAASDGQPAFNVYTVSKSHASVTSQGVLTVTPQYSIDDAPKPDLIVVPGGNSSAVTGDAAFMQWIVEGARASELTMTVCTGAYALGRAGLLDGLDVTTFYNAIDGLQAAAPKAHVQRGRRFVDNGHYVTTAGVSAGMDGALHVVARLLGRRVADATAQYMEYRWTPEPYLVGGYPLLNPSLDAKGKSAEQAELLDDAKRAEAARIK
jgi:transcriptional regulator GlxA family with amidase domain